MVTFHTLAAYDGDPDMDPDNFHVIKNDSDVRVGDLVGFWENEAGWWWVGIVMKKIQGFDSCWAKVWRIRQPDAAKSIFIDRCSLRGGRVLNLPNGSKP